ncbi:non-specific serine/threonine protein kinase [Saccharopolyspora erythraea NRRL 2338]|uniref:Protein kinase/transcriptional regulator, LuxR family n=2 Tax=Saccharopolyspora erythraea TaxID=1836 RepID=A4FQM9_SACEN|nr:LuxR C-terminal-related transcriptional regulator [Saccharopolyspora erythraea]EQD87687.1 LuxR family transcriptional regulator [Saccharopolyspora erythraea D]PFG92957.1 non-specific serine/threonine protein kinase [Saccharopolyspora erythraea NRRL 2338]QRK89851.1 AAA family ATPase [Saccharopolyspora erythraea]CAM06354.1 protein kinase/transcriptional regulator, LuxR family [Saccharopolyspora erythraea NRRL 2338]
MSRAGELPAEVTRFVGRAEALTEGARWLASGREAAGEGRLLVLTGIGGAGKTRLAVRLARQERDQGHYDEVKLVELAGVSGGDDVVMEAIGRALGLRRHDQRPRAERVVEHLGDRRVLLVLDNCEELVEPVGRSLTDLLRAAPGLSVLATSRRSLGLHACGEYDLRLGPLEVPAADAAPDRADASEAVELFRVHAVRSAPGFVLDASTRPLVVEIVRLLDGLPLSIELVACRLRGASLPSLAAMVRRWLHELTDDGKSVPAPLAALRSVMWWTYESCPPEQQRLWRRLSVFRDGFTLAAAEHVGGDDLGGAPVDELLLELVDRSVLTLGRDGRYQMLETLRQTGLDRLRAAGEESRIADRHLGYYRLLAHDAARGWYSEREIEALQGMGREMPNVRAALSWCETGNRKTDALLLLCDLGALRIWCYDGLLPEGVDWFRRILALPAEAPPEVEAVAWAHTTVIVVSQGLGARSGREVLANAERALERTDDPGAAAAVEYARGTYLGFAAASAESAEVLANALDAARRVGAPGGTVHMISLFRAVFLASYRDDPQEALSAGRELVADADRHGARWAQSWAVWPLAVAETGQGHPERALPRLRAALRTQLDIEDAWGPPWFVELCAWALESLGHNRAAAQVFGAARALQDAVGADLFGLGVFSARHTAACDRVIAAIGRRAFDTAYEQGRSAGAASRGGASPRRDHAEIVRMVLRIIASLEGTATPVPGDVVLTRRETEVARLVAHNLTNREIAARLVLSPRTVETHVQNVLNKWGVSSREAVAQLVPVRLASADETEPGG